MTKSQHYYYEDVVFQMDLNLQTIRRELIKLIEEHKFFDCYSCNRLKCCCSSVSSFRSTTLSIASSDSACAIERKDLQDTYYTTAPPAHSLPTPKWPEKKTRNEYRTPQNKHSIYNSKKQTTITLKKVNSWIKASIPNIKLPNSKFYFPVPQKVLDGVNYSWPPFPKSVWSEERLIETLEREDVLYNASEKYNNNSVEAFFKCFSKTGLQNRTFAC